MNAQKLLKYDVWLLMFHESKCYLCRQRFIEKCSIQLTWKIHSTWQRSQASTNSIRDTAGGTVDHNPSSLRHAIYYKDYEAMNNNQRIDVSNMNWNLFAVSHSGRAFDGHPIVIVSLKNNRPIMSKLGLGLYNFDWKRKVSTINSSHTDSIMSNLFSYKVITLTWM
jgi:hypothetical protein